MRTGQAFRERREALGISQEQVAAQAGLSSASIRNFEAGKQVRTSTARKINEALRALEHEDQDDSAGIARRLVGVSDDDVTEYLLGLSAEDSDRFLARFLAERARRAQQGTRRAGTA